MGDSKVPVALPIAPSNGAAATSVKEDAHRLSLEEGMATSDRDSDTSSTISSRRGGYKCRKCGQPKAGHICLAANGHAMTRSAGTQCDLNMTRSDSESEVSGAWDLGDAGFSSK